MLKLIRLWFLILLFSLNNAIALTVLSPVKMDFDNIEYTSGGGNGAVFLATNGNLSYSGSFSGAGFGTAGNVLIRGGKGQVINIGCSNSMVISNGSNTLGVINLEYVIGTANGVSFGSAIKCLGINNFNSSHTITKNSPQDTLLIGGEINTNSSNIISGSWSSTLAGGSGATIKVVLQ